MNYIKGEVYQNFKLQWVETVKDINSECYFFKHEKNGAELLYIKNSDINKVFTIGFKTLPEDSCGTPHILEHSVLNGSRKYPVKEPFMELVKGSLKTFLNAFTASDKTMYPFASTNQKDFMNLMDVYLDAVFYPRIYNTEEIFLQEGWHHEIFNKEDDIIYNGVVYNEMKGAFSSPESVLFRKIQNVQNPDNCYQFESGGDPDVITELSYEKFLNFHKKYYHPSNSYICLYGDLDFEVALKKIDNEYLTDFGILDIDTDIKEQVPFTEEKEEIGYYPVSDSDTTDNKAFISINYTMGHIKDSQLAMSMALLDLILLEYEGAPLKKALLEAGFGEDVFSSYNDSNLQPVLSIVIKNTSADKKEEIKALIDSTLRNLIKTGIDKKLIEAAISHSEFSLREVESRSFAKGLVYQMAALKGWMHCGNPKLYLEFEDRLAYVKKALSEPYFEELIEQYILNNNHKSTLILLPKKGMGEAKSAALAKTLKDYKESLTEQQLAELIAKNEVLRKRQQTPDSEEDINKIPHIELEDINPNPQPVEFKVTEEGDYTYLEVEKLTNKIAYIKLDFDAKVLDMDEWKWLSIFNALITKVDTKNFTYSELSNEIHINIGSFAADVEMVNGMKNYEDYYIGTKIAANVLFSKIDKFPALLEEIVLNSKFDDKNRVKQILMENKSRMEMMMMSGGHMVAINKARANLKPEFAFREETSGFTYYKFICSLLKDFDSMFATIEEKLELVRNKVIRKKSVRLAISGEHADNQYSKDLLAKFINKLAPQVEELGKVDFKPTVKHEALASTANVQYCDLTCDYNAVNMKFNGAAEVLNNVLPSGYLYNNIRVQGGAYGAMFTIANNGNFSFVSYRDPNLARTYETYKGVPQFIENFTASKEEMTKLIIGTIANFDIPFTPQSYFATACMHHLKDVDYAQRLKLRTEILATTVEDINSFAPFFKEAIENGIRVTVGGSTKINEDKELFDTITDIFE